MLHKYFTRILRLVLPDPARIPEFTCDTEVLAASHQRIGSTSLGSCGNTIGGEVILLTTSDGDKSEKTKLLAFGSKGKSGLDTVNKNVLSYRPLQTSAYSLVTVFGVTILSLRGTRPHPPGPNALLRIRRYLISGR
jgi:hypothetical protein